MLASSHTALNPYETMLDSTIAYCELLKEIITSDKPLIPFMLISHLATNHWEAYLATVLNMEILPEDKAYKLKTSCVKTAYAIAIIFFGKDIAEKMYAAFDTQIICDVDVELLRDRTWSYKLIHVLGSGIFYEFNNDANNDALIFRENLTKYGQPAMSSFLNYMQPIIDRCFAEDGQTEQSIISKLQYEFENICFDFNSTTFDALRKDINAKKEVIDPNITSVYYITIMGPQSSKPQENVFLHCFLIEQFFLSSAGEVRYHIYDSWIENSTLQQSLDRYQYGDHGQQALSHDRIHQFIDNFEAIYSPKKENIKHISYRSCFGYPFLFNKSQISNFSENTLTGISVRYLSRSIEPTQCILNLSSFFKARQRADVSSPEKNPEKIIQGYGV